jgi:uncharacterized protein (UPF0332 family)
VSVTPEDWLNEARRHAGGPDEISLRTAISRGYYAGYHQALTVSHWCPRSPSSNQDQGVHAALIGRFNSVSKNLPGSTSARSIATYLSKSRAFRRTADYELNATVRPNDARQCIQFAEKIAQLTVEFAGRYAEKP